MANTYQFSRSDNSQALRSGDNAFLPWNPQANQPVDINGAAGNQWKADGSPIPSPYVRPTPAPRAITPDRLGRLYTVVDKTAPGAVDTVTVDDWSNKATWIMWWNATATQPQKDAVNAAVASFDLTAIEAGDPARSTAYIKDADSIDLIDRLRNATPAQIENWVDTNVTNIATAQAAFKKIIKVLARLV